jgi:predicted short-subunit dehydrogenase-like oxidoreductase (DUF2520 family)
VALRIVIFGPGRVGVAFARALAASGAHVLGFVGRDPGRTAAAVAAAGVGAALPAAAHAQAHAVVFAVGDGDLRAAVDQAVAAAPPRPCSLWLHTSGRHGLEAFDGVPDIRRGIVHPATPVPAPTAAGDPLRGAPGVLVGDPRAQTLLRALCRRLGLLPIEGHGGDRALYHAACALAANGLTALFADAAAAFAASGVVRDGDGERLVAALMRGALAACAERGPVDGLTGAVRRGDADTVAAHLRALRAQAPLAAPAYLATAAAALRLARAAGLDARLAADVARVLDG